MNHRGKGELKFCSQLSQLTRTASDLMTHMLSFEVSSPSLPSSLASLSPSIPPSLPPYYKLSKQICLSYPYNLPVAIYAFTTDEYTYSYFHSI